MPDMYRSLGFLFTYLFFGMVARAQDTLPRFSAIARGTGKILISWHNNYPVVSQISIQRSPDSLKNFATLLTVPDPALPENGAVDNRVPHPNFYYRLFVVLENGKYFFTPSRRPGANTGETPATTQRDNADNILPPAPAENERVLFITPNYFHPGNNQYKPRVNTPSAIHGAPEIEVEKPIFVRRGDSALGSIPGSRIHSFRDSLLNRTKDTLVFLAGDSLLIKPFVPMEVYRVSAYVYTAKYGNIQVSLPDAGKRRYSVKFFDENSKLLFELSAIKDPSLTLDKTNFQHAGWFHFELYEDDRLKEKNKFFIPREF
jgi:hypothetical protein